MTRLACVFFVVAVPLLANSAVAGDDALSMPKKVAASLIEGQVRLTQGPVIKVLFNASTPAVMYFAAEGWGVALIPVLDRDGRLLVLRDPFLYPDAEASELEDGALEFGLLPPMSFRHVKPLASFSLGKIGTSWELDPGDGDQPQLCCMTCMGATVCGGTVITPCGSCPTGDYQDWQYW